MQQMAFTGEKYFKWFSFGLLYANRLGAELEMHFIQEGEGETIDSLDMESCRALTLLILTFIRFHCV